MSWLYEQSTGKLYRNGLQVDTGYSGNGDGKNNPAMQDVPNVGPLPAGTYTIDAPIDHIRLGPEAMPLTPDPQNEMFGRSDFLIHADSIHNPGHASEGCIVLANATRRLIWASGERTLEVVPTKES